MARELAAAPQRRRLRAHRHHARRVRDDGELARRRAQRPHRQPRPPRRRDVPAHGGRLVEHGAASPGAAAAWPSGAGTAACAALGEVFGELPAACLAEEIETPGEGQVRALITIAGNPAVSTPNASAWPRRSSALDFMVSVDIYVNETTRHADVILPAPSPLQRSHYDVALLGFAVRNVANYSPPVLAPEPDMPAEWETLLRLTGVVTGQGPNADVAAHRPTSSRWTTARRRRPPTRTRPSTAATPRSCWPSSRRASGPSGCSTSCCAPGPTALTLADLEAAPHGIDLGPLEPRVPEVLRTPSGRIELAPEALVADVARLHEALAEPVNGAHGPRRPPRPALQQLVDAQPADARQRQAALHRPRPPRRRRAPRAGRRRAGASCARAPATVVVPVEVTDDVMPGVVSIPHGWGHDQPGAGSRWRPSTPGRTPTCSPTSWLLEPLSGTAILNGIPVELEPV